MDEQMEAGIPQEPKEAPRKKYFDLTYVRDWIQNTTNESSNLKEAFNRSVSEVGAKVKTFFDFNDQQQQAATVKPPWSGCEYEDHVREQCLALSLEQSNFTRSPPDYSDYVYDPGACCTLGKVMLELDPNLAAMRYRLVPAVVSEDVFWRNYFYRVNLICKDGGSRPDWVDDTWDEELFRELEEFRLNDECGLSDLSDL